MEEWDDEVKTEPRELDSDEETSQIPFEAEEPPAAAENSLNSGWSRINPGVCEEREFKGSQHGATFTPMAAESENPLFWFHQFWAESMTRRMTAQTNLYNAQCSAKDSVSQSSKKRDWINVTSSEFHTFISILICLGLNHSPAPRRAWGDDPLFHNEFVSVRMCRDRFLDILRFLHVSDNNDTAAAASDSLYKIRWLMGKVNIQCKKNWNLGKFISVDEIDIGNAFIIIYNYILIFIFRLPRLEHLQAKNHI